MATLCFAASIFVAVAVDRLLCGRATPPPPPTPPISLSLSDANIEWVLTHCENLERQLVRQQRDYRQLQLVTASSQAKYLQLERRFLSNEEQYERRCAQLESDNARLQDLVDSRNKELRVQPFVYFFDKLLLANKMWKQQKDLAQAKSALVEREQEIRTHAFRNFRDRVLAANLVWKQQTQMKKLREEAERIKKGRVRAVTRSAKQMVLDTRKDGLIEELVKGLIKDVEEGRERERRSKEKYEREIEEMTGEHQRLLREIEALQLGQCARLIEQEISNEQEDRLIASLVESRKEVQRLETEVSSTTTCP